MEPEEHPPDDDNEEEEEAPITSQVLEYYRNYSHSKQLHVYLRGSFAIDIPVHTDKMEEKHEESQEKLPEIVAEPDDNIRNPSPASSVTSNRKLEWDNGADIGYDNLEASKTLQKSHSFPLLTPHIMACDIKNTASETLKKTNSNNDFDGDLLTNISEVDKVAKYSSSSSSFCAEYKPQLTTDSDSNSVGMRSIKNKVGSPMAESTPLNRFTPSSNSTSDDSKKVKVIFTTKQPNLCLTKPVVVECKIDQPLNEDKLIQTTLIKNATKSMQTDSKIKQIEVKQNVVYLKHSDSEKDSPSLAQTDSDVISNCNSFEYLYGDAYNENLQKQNSLKRSKNKIDLTNVSSTNATSDSSSSVNDSSKSSPLGKLLSKPLSKNLNEDIERTFNLLQMLMKSKNYDEVTKKHYLKRIMQKIINNKYEGDENSDEKDEVKLHDNVPWVPAVQACDIEPIVPVKTDRKVTVNAVVPKEKSGEDAQKKRSKFTLPNTSSENNTSSSSSHNKTYMLSQQYYGVQTTTSDSSLEKSWKDAKTKSELLLEKMPCGDSDGATTQKGLIEFASKECESQLTWINNEILYLNKLKELLQKHCKSDESIMNAILKRSTSDDIQSVKKSTTVYMITTEKSKKCPRGDKQICDNKDCKHKDTTKVSTVECPALSKRKNTYNDDDKDDLNKPHYSGTKTNETVSTNRSERILRKCFCGSYTYPPASSTRIKSNKASSQAINTKVFDCNKYKLRLSELNDFPVDVKNAKLVSTQSYTTDSDLCGEGKTLIQRFCFEIPLQEDKKSETESVRFLDKRILQGQYSSDDTVRSYSKSTFSNKSSCKCISSESSKSDKNESNFGRFIRPCPFLSSDKKSRTSEEKIQTSPVRMLDKCNCTSDLKKDEYTLTSFRPKCACKSSQTHTDEVVTSTRINKLYGDNGLVEAAPETVHQSIGTQVSKTPSSQSVEETSGSTSESSTSSTSNVAIILCPCCKTSVSKPPCQDNQQNQSPVFCHLCYNNHHLYKHPNYYMHPNHVCRCYQNQQNTIQEMRNTITELKNLEYCKCNFSNRKDSTYCSYCKCKLKNANQNPKGIAYMITLESESITNGSPDNKTIHGKPLEEIKIKVPTVSSKKKRKEEENRKRSSKAKNERAEGSPKKKHSKKKKLSLQEYLQQNKPNFIESAEERRRCLIELSYLREERCQKYKQLLALTSGLNNVDKHTDESKPKHMFTSKQMRMITEKNYKKLPEVQQKLLDDRDRRIKQANRLLANIFNKKLRENVLKGKRTISPSVSIIGFT